MHFSKSVKLWILITILSYLAYNLWGISNSIAVISSSLIADGDFVSVLMIFSLPLMGLTLRFVGSILALYVIYLVWVKKTQRFIDLKRKLSLIVLMEAIYFILIIPNFIFIILFGSSVILVSYVVQMFLTIPFLFILRKKIINNKEPFFGFDLLKWFLLTYVAYLVAIWVNHVTRWLDMSLSGGLVLLQTSLNPLGVFNTFVILSLAVIFAVINFLKAKPNKLLSKWFGISLTLVGLHFIVLLVFYALINSFNQVTLFEIWLVPLFGLGLSILLKKD